MTGLGLYPNNLLNEGELVVEAAVKEALTVQNEDKLLVNSVVKEFLSTEAECQYHLTNITVFKRT